MNIAFNTRLALAWLALAGLTVVYLLIDRTADSGGGLLTPSAVVTASAILIAAIKVRIIFREFMDVRHAPPLLCRLTDAWILIIVVSLLTSCFVGAALR
ncbi:hypothetical protein BN970_03510 [Mycolicibacterium conceptionense]|uniref:Prokaryotic cytochrome C oxidase subunit IV family protein n=1 Tax=Mycolicibacterium conceptionense TaxID=451644 RepID=A0A0U1DH78_9MYCO|nr:cytochrome C oxidase subunit IV family protein [Mycolicibacterium conceptionense]ORV24628.1 hypothetical protein AWB98_20490 [Mycolicibacterium conceptionense]CQD16499.1 hypothetical protein BN970_03510 [Mycolicibacterium conceptionense]